MSTGKGKLWFDIRLNQEEMNFLHDACSGPEHRENWNNHLAGNISKSEQIEDKGNWFYENVLKKHTERMFYRDCSNYYEDYIEKEKPLPKFEMNTFWVNYMKQHEFNPLHNHSGLYSFVVFVKIPTHWKEQHALPISINSAAPVASDFAFVRSEKNDTYTKDGYSYCVNLNFQLSPEDEGRMLFFPAWLQHQVYPFYECEEDRVTISGNIDFIIPKKLRKEQKIIDSSHLMFVKKYEEQEKMLKMLEESVRVTKEDMKMMKKEREKVGPI